MDASQTVARSVVALRRGGRGCGFVLEPGRVVVVAPALRAERLELERGDGERTRATLLGRDADQGLTVLAADTGNAPALAWPETDPSPRLGQRVSAVARPAGRPLYVTSGEVAALGERVRGLRGRLGDPGIVHTAPLPRGSGGSPLLDEQGALLGLSVARLDGGFVLALPATAALRARLDDLAERGGAAGRSLGVAIAAPRTARRLRAAVGLPDRGGLLVQEVAGGSAAAAAGLAAGDLIVAAGGEEATSADVLLAAVDAGGHELALRVVRGVDERDVLVHWE